MLPGDGCISQAGCKERKSSSAYPEFEEACVQLDFENTVLEQDDHSHGLFAALHELHDRPMISLFHVLSVDR